MAGKAPWSGLAAGGTNALATGIGMEAPQLLRLAKAPCIADLPVLKMEAAFLEILGKPGANILNVCLCKETASAKGSCALVYACVNV